MSFQDVNAGSPRRRPASSSPPEARRSRLEARRLRSSFQKRPTTPTTHYHSNTNAPPPDLRLRCPVTDRHLIDPQDDAKLNTGRTTTSYDESSCASASLEESLPPVPSSGRATSIYAHLTKEIVNYQKMVAELESLLVPSSTSPESQWRSRILMHSARDADRDIWKRLYEYEATEAESDSRSQVACRKLHRDFQRVHNLFMAVLEEYDRRQQVEVSFLSSSAPASEEAASEEKKEDFFDRAMREREDELKNIRSSMNQVNDIYTDLAALVEDQQEQVDEIAEKLGYSRAATEAGADQIHRVTAGLCGSMNTVDDNVIDRRTDPNKRDFVKKSLRVGEDFTWTMPFETIQDDIREVQKDIQKVQTDFFHFGRELYEDLTENSPYACNVSNSFVPEPEKPYQPSTLQLSPQSR